VWRSRFSSCFLKSFKRGLPPTFERAARDWQRSRSAIAERTEDIARVAIAL